MINPTAPLNLKDPRIIHRLLIATEPFLGYIFQGIRVKFVDEDVPFHSMACSSNTIFIKNSYVESVTGDKLNEFIAILIHEMLHIYKNHHSRFGFTKGSFLYRYRNVPWLPEVINRCLDAVINEGLINAGYTFLETDACTLRSMLPPDHPRINDSNWNENDLIAYVVANSTFETNSSSGEGEGEGQGTGSPSSSGTSSQSGSPQKGKGSKGKSQGQQAGQEQSQGSGNEGTPKDNPDGYTVTLPNGQKIQVKYQYSGDLIVGDEDDEEIASQEKSMSELAKKAAKELKGKNRGRASANEIPDDIPDVEKTEIPWEERLRQLAISATSKKLISNYKEVQQQPLYTMAYGGDTSKLTIDYPYIRKPEPNLVIVMMDLSGSIYGDLAVVRQFCHQISDIARHVGNLLFMPFDYGLLNQFHFDMATINEDLGDLLIREKETYIVGGGGTDVKPLFEILAGQHETELCNDIDINQACMVVVFTDLYIGPPIETELEPTNCNGPIPTIWVVPESDWRESNQPLFGDVVLVK